ncbi:MAG: 2-oxoacid:acceptor oxidoreductase subunit alpha [Actinomycetota bacterium]|nr:2-oxoacid:acceptor oxidoreductase subunit alpha [Actinomycetota bacterium]
MTKQLIMGNEAVVLGAIAAGCDFYAGYPITPATEIMEEMAKILPGRGGVFIQMEDELSAIAAVIGAAWGGAVAMTATSGPGFSLMQENIGYAAMTQTPCVIVDSQRGGPSTGLPTLPSQSDVLQSKFGSHGDRAAIVLTASSVLGAYTATIRAFQLAQRHRMPVILLLDAVVSHMREPVELPSMPPPTQRNFPTVEPGADRFDQAPFVPFGYGPVTTVSGLSHNAKGQTGPFSGAATERMLRAAIERLEQDDEITRAPDTYQLDDAEVALVAYGITARAGIDAVDILRSQGLRAGMVTLEVIWPFPTHAIQSIADDVPHVVIAELNLGQLVLPVSAAVAGRAQVHSLTLADGSLLTPEAIAEFIMKRTSQSQEVTHA